MVESAFGITFEKWAGFKPAPYHNREYVQELA
jgi:hypothetical protein